MKASELVVNRLIENEDLTGADYDSAAEDALAGFDEDNKRKAALQQTGAVTPETVKVYQYIYFKDTGQRAKVTSIKTWKTRPDDFEIGWKHGLRTYGKVTPSNASSWTTIEPTQTGRRR